MIRYKVEMEDVVAFNQHFLSSSPVFQANRRKGVLTLLPVFLVLGVLQSLSRESFTPLIVWTVVGSGLAFWTYRKSGKVVPARVVALYPPEQNPLVLCEHELETLPEWLLGTTPLSETRTRYNALLRIDETPSHVFLFTGSNQAIIIPRDKILGGDLDAFLSRLRAERARFFP